MVPARTERKVFCLPNELWQEIARYRHGNEIASEAEAMRRLIRKGLEAERGLQQS